MWASSLVIVNSSGRLSGFVFFFSTLLSFVWRACTLDRPTDNNIVPVAITMSGKVPMLKDYRGDLHKCKQEVQLSLLAPTLHPKP